MRKEPRAELAPLTTLRVGGRAAELLRATSEAEIVEALRAAREAGRPVLPLGGGSNLVVADEGVDAWVLKLENRGVEERREGDSVRVTVQAGESWDAFTARVCEQDLQGVECLGGIPGAVGATPIQNVGAYGQEVADTVESVRVVDRASLEVLTLPASACGFAYRDSFFKRGGAGRFVVSSVTFRLHPGRRVAPRYPELTRALAASTKLPSLVETRRAVIELRRAKSMVLDLADPDARSCGSFFVNPVIEAAALARIEADTGLSPPRFEQDGGLFKIPAAWLIENAGLSKGFTRGPAGLSSKHCLALIAGEGARARDVVELARFVQDTVHDRFGVELLPEPHFWGFGALDRGLPRPPDGLEALDGPGEPRP